MKNLNEIQSTLTESIKEMSEALEEFHEACSAERAESFRDGKNSVDYEGGYENELEMELYLRGLLGISKVDFERIKAAPSVDYAREILKKALSSP